MSPRRLLALLTALLLSGAASADDKPARVVPLRHAHAHNDYLHPRPLFDALDQGFCSVEADIFLKDGALLVGHTAADLKPERTLEKLYLEPLRERAKANGGKIFPKGPSFYLLIDVKTEAKTTYAALDKVLARYADLLSIARRGQFEEKAVTAVVSGNCDRAAITAQDVRYAAVDGRPPDLDADAPAHLVPWVSASWGSLFRWQGTGAMPDEEKTRLRDFVRKAHRRGRLVRFWATPESPAVWKELRDAEVDLLNTDRLAELRKFFAER